MYCKPFWLKVLKPFKPFKPFNFPTLVFSSVCIMQALKAMLSPDRKRSKTTGAGVAVPESDEEEMYEASAIQEEDEYVDSDEGLEIESVSNDEDDQPAWARKQEKRMLQRFEKMMTGHMEQVKNDIVQIKMQASLAVATADEAMAKMQEVTVKVNALDEQRVSIETVNQKIEEAIEKLKGELQFPKLPISLSSGRAQRATFRDDTDKVMRTMVVGGFAQDSDRDVVIDLINKHVISEDNGTVDETYAYAFGSIGFVRFKTPEQMREFLRKFGNSPKPQADGKDLWTTASKSPEERNKAKHLGKHKRVLIEVGLATAGDIKIDYRHGILMVKRHRVAEWKGEGDDGHVEINEEALTEVGITVGATALKNAVEELLSK